jgi:glutathione S-transferase
MNEGAMILIGQYDSPFVRRVAIALTIYALPYDHRPWSVFADAGKVRAYNPLGRVPTLVLTDGTALLESTAILDYLDEQSPHPLMPRAGTPRRDALRRCALAMGAAEKAVALVYETRLHAHPEPSLVARIESQITAVLSALEPECPPAAFWHGDTPGHADIALACAAAFIAQSRPALLNHPSIQAHAARCEALPAFQSACQAFLPPA